MRVVFKHRGSFKNLENFLDKSQSANFRRVLEKYADRGVVALREATPVDTGLTKESWGYAISSTKKGSTITWTNRNVVDGTSIALILQYGHATRNGGYVAGRDYINPAIRPIFDQMSKDIMREVGG